MVLAKCQRMASEVNRAPEVDSPAGQAMSCFAGLHGVVVGKD